MDARKTAAVTPPLDLNRLRRDFPILERQVHGKPLVYLSSHSSAST